MKGSNVLRCKLCLGRFLDPLTTFSARNFCHTKIYLIFAILQKYNNSWKYGNFWGKIKLKTRLVAGNSIWPAKIRPEGPLSPLELLCKMFWYHLKNSLKKTKKTYPSKKGFFLGEGDFNDRNFTFPENGFKKINQAANEIWLQLQHISKEIQLF